MEFKAAVTLSEQIAQHLSDRIIRAELAPREKILEAKLAEEMDVSRGPLREALRILEKKRLVELTPRRGARVTDLSVAYIEWQYELLTELYAMALRRCAENRTEEDLQNIRAAVKKIEDRAEGGDSVGYFDAIFEYASLGQQAAGNPLLDQTLRDLEPITRRAQFASLSLRVEDLRKNVFFFQRMTQYIEEGNGKMAAETARGYVRNEKEFAMKNAEGWSVPARGLGVKSKRVTQIPIVKKETKSPPDSVNKRHSLLHSDRGNPQGKTTARFSSIDPIDTRKPTS